MNKYAYNPKKHVESLHPTMIKHYAAATLVGKLDLFESWVDLYSDVESATLFQLLAERNYHWNKEARTWEIKTEA